MQQNILTAVFQHKFSSLIWKVETDESRHMIGIETRSAENHTAAFSAFNYRTGNCYFNEIMVEESWWQGLDRIYGGYVFLHGYMSEGNPVHKGITALNTDGTVRWQLYNLALEEAAADGLVVYNPSVQPRRLEYLSADSGQVTGKPVGKYQKLSNTLHFPQLYRGSEQPAPIPGNVTGPVYHTLLNGRECWSYHTIHERGLSQHLLVIEGGQVLIHDYLARDIQKLNPETFFIQQNQLFCIRDKTEIISYLL